MSIGFKQHWDRVYLEKSDQEVSWYQEVPATSLRIVEELHLDKSDAIIDVGGGNSNLSSELLIKGFKDLSVLDISTNSIEKMKRKLGEGSNLIQWINTDVLVFKSHKKFAIWHDRAVFHFLTDTESQEKYRSNLLRLLDENGYFILSTFSTTGPKICSGLDVCQYDEKSLQSIFGEFLELKNIFNEDHKTPSGGIQNFIVSIWKKSN